MRTKTATGAAILGAAVLWAAAAPRTEATDEGRWWNHVRFLADDARQGRVAGSPGHREAAEYVAREFEKAGAVGVGTDGYFQPVALLERKIREERTSFELVRDGRTIPLRLREDVLVAPASRAGQPVEAEMVFAGYGARIPEAGTDDFAGLDVKGRIVVTIAGAPAKVPGPLASHYSSGEERNKLMRELGAVGTLALMNPMLQEIPWRRMGLMQSDPTADLADPGLAQDLSLRVRARFNPEHAGVLFEGSGHTFEEVMAAHRERRTLPKFALAGRLRAKTVYDEARRVSENVVAKIPGADPKLKDEYVLLSAHLDHIGVGEPIDGDAIRNGAMDNASGVASLLEVARMLHEGSVRPRRSVLLLACTAEEKGLLGSKYYAGRPTVPLRDIVADVNLDMMLPLTPLKLLRVYGLRESDLADRLQAAAKESGVELQDDPEPQRNIFIRSDQYSFIKTGVPSLSMKFGYLPGSPEEKIHLDWMRERYHGPKDDLAQPVDKAGAAAFNHLMARLALQVANADQRPAWRAESFFRRYAKR